MFVKKEKEKEKKMQKLRLFFIALFVLSLTPNISFAEMPTEGGVLVNIYSGKTMIGFLVLETVESESESKSTVTRSNDEMSVSHGDQNLSKKELRFCRTPYDRLVGDKVKSTLKQNELLDFFKMCTVPEP